MWPVDRPIFTDALIAELIAEARTAERKAQAYPTPFRFSDAGACSRVLAYAALGLEPTEPMDAAGLWVTGLGTMIHEMLQAALKRRYPQARVEIKGLIETVTSGHCDALVVINGVRWLYELKTTGGYAYDKATGLNRKGHKRGDPAGPRRGALLQAGLNAMAHECSMVAIGYIAMEAVSMQLAEKLGLTQLDRVLAEWHIPEEVWRPLAEDEIVRQRQILQAIDTGQLPVAQAIDDDGEPEYLDPLARRPSWRCVYCRYRSRCEHDGAHRQQLPDDLREET